MLYAYLDETGQESKNWVFIAGFLGNEDQWRKFAPAWREALGPQRKSLHMSELRFKKEREKRLLERLGPIPVSCGLDPMVVGVRVSDYADLVGDNPLLKQVHCGYVIAVQVLTCQALRVIPPTERLELIFEEQRVYSSLVDIAMRYLSVQADGYVATRDGKPKLAKCSYVPKISTCLIEPADYFAYAMGQYHKDKTSRRTQWCMPILRSVDAVHPIGALSTKEQTRILITAMNAKLKQEGLLK